MSKKNYLKKSFKNKNERTKIKFIENTLKMFILK